MVSRPNAPVAQMVDKVELMYGIVASFNILMKYFYRLQQSKTERVPAYVIHLEGVLNVIQKDFPYMLSLAEVQNHLCDQLFHHLKRSLHD